jgi:two-component system sensor histidine kinase DegS
LITQAVEAERCRLARELHDGPTQELALIARMANAAAARLGDARLIRIAAAAERGLERCRYLISELRGCSDDTFDVELARLLIGLEPDVDAEIDFHFASPVTLDQAARAAAVAIAREAILNAASHSCANTIRVRLSAGDGVSLSIRDDGVGFDPAAAEAGGFGLTGMRERAQLAGGDLRIDSAPGAGTLIEVMFSCQSTSS